MVNKKTIASLAVAGVFAAAAGSAQAVLISPNGTGAAGPVFDVAALGWNTGNAISTPINTADGTVNATVVGDTITTFGHAALQGFNDANGNNIFTGTDLSTWTYVFKFEEVVADADNVGQSASRTFRTINPANSFFEIWVGGLPGDNLSGQGFSDGGLGPILSGQVLAFDALTGAGQTSFNSSSANAQPLDQFGSNQYSGYDSVSGTGGGSIKVDVQFANAAYFLDALDILTLNIVTDTFQNLPYQQTNPSSCYWDGAAYQTAAGNGLGCGAAGDFGSIGSFNGAPVGNGPNTMFQTRATTAFPGVVPEPGSIALVGLGLAVAGVLRRRKA